MCGEGREIAKSLGNQPCKSFIDKRLRIIGRCRIAAMDQVFFVNIRLPFKDGTMSLAAKRGLQTNSIGSHKCVDLLRCQIPRSRSWA